MSSNAKTGRRGRRWIIVAVVLGALLGTAIVAASALRSQPSIDPSKIATVERGDIARSVVATGKIEPLTKVEVKSKASGLVNSVHVDYGQRVTRGQVLAELDKEQLAAQLRE